MDILDPQISLIVGMSLQIPIALAGMMAAFNWSAFLERGDQDGVRSYRANAILLVAALIVQPAMLYFLH
mgnify:CR=1 FL=1